VTPNDPNVPTHSRTPLESRSLSNRQGEDARVSAADQAFDQLKKAQREANLQDPALFLRGVKPSRRIILPPPQQHDLIMRDGTRSSPPRRSARLRKEVVDSSPEPENSGPVTGVSSQSTAGLATPVGESLPDQTELLATELMESLLISKHDLLDIEDETDNIDEFTNETPYDILMTKAMNNDLEHEPVEAPSSSSRYRNTDKIDAILHSVEDQDMKDRLKKWLYKYTEVFDTELNERHAKTAPFVFETKPDSNWHSVQANKAAPRWQMMTKQKEVERFINQALKAKLIRPSKATAWSQVHLTPKPNGKWRFCIDFRNLNANTTSEGWPLPNIKDIMQRISQTGAKYFAVLDLTQGYYQMLIDETCRHLTAFRTAFGLFEWCRLPMGLKGAGSFYQRHMQLDVLEGLIYQICESYLDDILVYGKTKKELSENLETVVARLRSHGMTINPEKVKINMEYVEYVGHIIDKYGFSFSDEKRQKVTDFRTPELAKDMKQFLGLISQFRDHVPGFSVMTAPFNDMIPNYQKGSTKPLQWTDELRTKFAELQDAVANCCKLYFMDETSPIYLHTDASIIGIGGYLFQEQERSDPELPPERIPIQFLNKQLNATERNWNIVEKEMYAIFYCFMKLDYILRDRSFILRTDSQILSRMNTDHKEKVKRWKIAIQHYDFQVQHIPGKLNVEADGLSRLVPKPEQPARLHVLEQTNTIEKRHHLSRNKYQMISRAHGGMIGHGGVQRTMTVLTDTLKLRWKRMRNDVTTFIDNCPCCQKMRRLKPQIYTIPFTLASYEPMRRVCVDAIGPINIDDQEQKHILVFIDAFSRYVMLFPVKTVNTVEALHAFNQWIAIFGVPTELKSDNASYFLSDLIKSFLEQTGLDHDTIHPYSHEENGLVERANQEVTRHLTAMIADHDLRMNWPKYLPFVQRILNTQVKTSTGISPTEMIFGNSVNHDLHFLTAPGPTKRDDPPHEHVKQLIAAQERIIRIAQQNQQDHDVYVIATRAKDKTHTTTFPINSYVLVQYETQKSSKLHTNKHGPYRVVNHIGTIYTCEHLVTKKKMDYHVKLLTEYKHDEVNSNIEKAAKLDDEYADIVKVLGHKFTPSTSKLRSNLSFLLTWDTDMNPKWYPWSPSLGANERIHEYLNDNQMRTFIPQKYTYPRDHPEEIARRLKQKNERKRSRSRTGF